MKEKQKRFCKRRERQNKGKHSIKNDGTSRRRERHKEVGSNQNGAEHWELGVRPLVPSHGEPAESAPSARFQGWDSTERRAVGPLPRPELSAGARARTASAPRSLRAPARPRQPHGNRTRGAGGARPGLAGAAAGRERSLAPKPERFSGARPAGRSRSLPAAGVSAEERGANGARLRRGRGAAFLRSRRRPRSSRTALGSPGHAVAGDPLPGPAPSAPHGRATAPRAGAAPRGAELVARLSVFPAHGLRLCGLASVSTRPDSDPGRPGVFTDLTGTYVV